MVNQLQYGRKERVIMQLMLKDLPILEINEDGKCKVLDFDRLSFPLRKEKISFIDFVEWASNRTLSLGRSFAKEILNTLRLSHAKHAEALVLKIVIGCVRMKMKSSGRK